MLLRQTLRKLRTVTRSVATARVENHETDVEYLSSKSYETVPKIPTMRMLWSLLKHKTEIDKVIKGYHEAAGPIFRFSIPGLPDRLFIDCPELVRVLLSKEGKYPIESSFDPIVHYRNVIRKDLFYDTAGLVGSHGEAWHEVRSKVQQDMMRPKSAMFYIKDVEEISQQFVDLLAANTDTEDEVEDLIKHVYCWSLESIAAIFLDTRLGSLEPALSEHSETRRFIAAVNVFLGPDMNDMILGLPIWKYVSTPGFRRWDRSMVTIFDITKKYVDRAVEKYKQEAGKEDNELSVLQKMIRRCGQESQIPLVMAQDAITAGVDTTGTTATFLLLDLARNPRQQEELYQEIRTVVKDGNITESTLNQMKYLKACLHESQRLNPAVSGINRTVPEDIALGGYQIPEGTIVTCFTRNIMLKPENFPDPLQFTPERWLRGCPQQHKAHPFAAIPFSHGPRMCVGKRFAELEVYILAIKVLQAYRLEYHHEPVGIQTDFVNKPDRKIKMKFIPRT